MKKLILLLAALLCLSLEASERRSGMPGGMRGMEEKEQMRPVRLKKSQFARVAEQEAQKKVKKQLSQKEGRFTLYSIKFGDKEFVVSMPVLQQFELYKTQKSTGSRFVGSREALGVKRKSAEMSELKSQPAKQSKLLMKTGTPLEVVWDVTQAVDELFSIEVDPSIVTNKKVRDALKQEARRSLKEEQRIDLEELVSFVIDITSNKMAPAEIEDKDELFMIIKMADHLGNKVVMERCNPVFMERLMVEHPLQDFSEKIFRGHTDWVNSVVLLPNNEFLSWSGDRTIRLWNINGTQIRTFAGHRNTVSGVILLPGGNQFLSWSVDSTIRLWDMNTGASLRTFTGRTQGVSGVILLPEANQFLAWSGDGAIRLWNINSDASLRTFTEHTNWVSGVILLPEGNQFLSWSSDGTIKRWNMNNPRALQTYQGHTRGVWDVVLLPNNEFLSCSNDNTIRRWDMNNPISLQTYQGHTLPVFGVILLPNNDFLSWAADNTIRRWTMNNPISLQTYQGHTLPVFGVILLPNNDFLSWAADNTIRRWTMNNPTALRTYEGHTQGVSDVILLPEGNQFLSCSHDRTIKRWDMNNPISLQTYQGHTDLIQGVVLLPNNKFLSWSGDRTIRLWNLFPFADLTFEQIQLCYEIFTSKKPVELVEGSDDHDMLMSLPQGLREHIIELKKIVFLPAEKRMEKREKKD